MTENDHQRIFEVSPIPTCVLVGQFPNILIKYANSAYISLTGRNKNEIIESPFFVNTPHPAMHMDEVGFINVRQSIQDVFFTKSVVKTPVQKFMKQVKGTDQFDILYLEATNTPVLNADGEIHFIVRTLQNVTDVITASEDNKAKDKKLVDTEQFVTETQKVAKIGGWEMDKNNRFYWSDIHYEIMEVEPGTEITVDFGVALLKGQKDRDLFNEVYKNAVEKGSYFDIELNIITPKGNERWIRFTGKGELADGEFVRMYGTGHDITDQKLTQQALLDSRNRLAAIIQTVDGVVFECDAYTLVCSFISEQVFNLLGYTPEECVNQPDFISKILHPEDREGVLALTYQQVQTNKNYSGDYRIIKKDGLMRWMNVSISIINENGVPKFLRGLMVDITTSKRMAELERVEKEVLELNAISSETTNNVLKAYLRGLEYVFPAMQCSIMQVNNNKLYNWVANSLPVDYLAEIDNLPIADNTGSCGTAAFKKTTVIVSDIANDYRWVNFKDVALSNNLRACWSQPLKNTAGEVIATFGIYYNTVKSPTEEELNVVDRAVYLLQIILQDRKNMELLEETNLLMEQSQELAHFGSVQYDLKTGKLTWSNELYNILGIDKNVVPNTDFYFDVLHPDDKESVKAEIDNIIKEKRDYFAEQRIIRPNGERRVLRTWWRVKSNENGEATKILSAYLDITDSKKIQEELLVSESRLRSLVDSQTNYVIRIDFDGNYTYANRKYIEDFGPQTGKSLLGTDAMGPVLLSQHQKIKDICEKCITRPNEVFEIELDKYANNGTVKHTFWHFVCLTNVKGEPTEMQCIGIDISDRIKAEDERKQKTIELRDSKKRYSDLFHLSPQPMWVYEPDTLQFLDVNNAALEQYGYTRTEFLSMTLEDIRPTEELPNLYNAIKSRKKNKDFFQGIFVHQTKSGEHIKVDLKRNRIPFGGKDAHLVLAINITEPFKYLEALEKQNAQLAEIAWIQSHIVRAPLTRIMGLINIFKDQDNDPAEEKLILDSITTAAAELDEVILDIVRKSNAIKLTGDN